MENFNAYDGLLLRGGFLLKFVRAVDTPMVDALKRPALARTSIVGMTFEIELDSRLTEQETSISLYHEVLEAAAVAATQPPKAVCSFNEGNFELAARQMHEKLGMVTPAAMDRMLELFGF